MNIHTRIQELMNNYIQKYVQLLFLFKKKHIKKRYNLIPIKILK